MIYGACAHVPTPATLDGLQQLGVSMIRVDLDWDKMQLRQGVDRIHWKATLDAVRGARKRGMSVLASIGRSPSWANGGYPHHVPPFRHHWVPFVTAVAEKLVGEGVEYFSLWNEPNLTRFWTGSLDQYLQLLSSGSEAVRAAGGLVVGPELAHSRRGLKWLRVILEYGSRHLDVISHHVYASSASRLFAAIDSPRWWWWASSSLRHEVSRAGALHPVWITETGFSSAGRDGERVQGEWWANVLAGLKGRDWIEGVFAYQIIDDPREPERWGLLRPDGTEKPSFEAYRRHIAKEIT